MGLDSTNKQSKPFPPPTAFCPESGNPHQLFTTPHCPHCGMRLSHSVHHEPGPSNSKSSANPSNVLASNNDKHQQSESVNTTNLFTKSCLDSHSGVTQNVVLAESQPQSKLLMHPQQPATQSNCMYRLI